MELPKTELLLPVIREIEKSLKEMQRFKHNDYGDLGSWIGEAVRTRANLIKNDLIVKK